MLITPLTGAIPAQIETGPRGLWRTNGRTVDLPLTVLPQANAYLARPRPPFFLYLLSFSPDHLIKKR